MINLTARARAHESERAGGLGESKEPRLKGAAGTEMQSKTGVKNGCVSAAELLVRSHGHTVQEVALLLHMPCTRKACMASWRKGKAMAVAIIEGAWAGKPIGHHPKSRERERESLGRERDEVGNHEDASWERGTKGNLEYPLGAIMQTTPVQSA